MTLKLGPSSEDLEITLVPEASWWTTLISVDNTEAENPVPYPDGVAIELRIGSKTFEATIIGAEATIRMSPAEVAEVIAEAPKEAKLWWSNGVDNLPWAIGPVYIDG